MSELPNNYSLQIVGDGPRRPILEKLAEEKNVEFLGIRTDIPDILSSTDIVVLSSHWEGLSLSSIEGMASGRPFIASDVDGLHEMVNGAGVLFPDGDHIALASAIRHRNDKRNAMLAATAVGLLALVVGVTIGLWQTTIGPTLAWRSLCENVTTNLVVKELAWECDCSEERLEKILMTIGKSDLEEIIREDGEAELVCQFCLKKYRFDKAHLERILDSIK